MAAVACAGGVVSLRTATTWIARELPAASVVVPEMVRDPSGSAETSTALVNSRVPGVEMRSSGNATSGPLPLSSRLIASSTVAEALARVAVSYGRVVADIRYGALDSDFAALCARLGLGEVALGRYKTGARGAERTDYRAYYDAEARARVASAFAPDIAAFGWRFDDEMPGNLPEQGKDG